MRRFVWLPVMLALGACSSGSANTSKLTLRNTQWDHVNMQVVTTKGSDCDARGAEFIGSQDFVLHKDQTKTITAPDEASVCWRHDRYPNNPKPGEWSGWSRAVLFPGSDTTTDI